MKKIKLLAIVLPVLLSGCSTVAELQQDSDAYEKKATMHEKGREYYESIGQTNAANEEYEASQMNQRAAERSSKHSIFYELFALLFD